MATVSKVTRSYIPKKVTQLPQKHCSSFLFIFFFLFFPRAWHRVRSLGKQRGARQNKSTQHKETFTLSNNYQSCIVIADCEDQLAWPSEPSTRHTPSASPRLTRRPDAAREGREVREGREGQRGSAATTITDLPPVTARSSRLHKTEFKYWQFGICWTKY